MRIKFSHSFALASIAVLLASCAQQPTRNTPVQPAPPPAVDAKAVPAPALAPKPKPKPKPAAPKPETKEPDVREPEAPREEGIDKAQVGYYFDTLQGRLRQSGDPKIVVSRRDSHITVDVTDRVHPGGDEAANCAALAPIAKALVEYRLTRVVVDVSAVDAAGANTAKNEAEVLARCLATSGVANKRVSATSSAPASRASVYLQIAPIVKTP